MLRCLQVMHPACVTLLYMPAMTTEFTWVPTFFSSGAITCLKAKPVEALEGDWMSICTIELSILHSERHLKAHHAPNHQHCADSCMHAGATSADLRHVQANFKMSMSESSDAGIKSPCSLCYCCLGAFQGLVLLALYPWMMP